MVCSADDLVLWKDFPKGLRVLLLDEDGPRAVETKLKLEAMDYIVFSYCNEKDALEAISGKAESFHVAVVEVTTHNSHGSFRFLEMAKDLPTIVISDVHCLSTTMKCIALGAAEFLQKPLSEDKLRNIWQHAVHKAFNAGENVVSKSLKPIRETVVSMLQLQSDTAELKTGIPSEAENLENGHGREHENTEENERLSSPSTPQLVKGGRLLDDGDCRDQPNCSTEKESRENANDSTEVRQYGQAESKSVDNTCNNIEVLPSRPKEFAAEEEVDSADGSNTGECSAIKEGSQPSSSHMQNGDNVESSGEDSKKKKSFLYGNSYSHGYRGNRKKMKKVDWTTELHRRFVRAVEQLGIDQAIPSKILELMKVEGLTRHNIASHLQKYRMHGRHILPKEERRWQLRRDPMPRGYMQKPPVACPPFHSNCVLPQSPIYPVWGHPSYRPLGIPMWGHAGFPTWHQSPGSWPWRTYPGIHADAWGCPVMPRYSQCSSIPPQSPTLSNGLCAVGGRSGILKDSSDFHLTEEVIDKVVVEAMSKPWLPLPLGLKPPSTDGVLAELHRQGIRTIPPPPPPLR